MDSVTSKGYWDAIHNNILNLPSKEDYVYFSPHYHIIHWGTMPNASGYHTKTKGWVGTESLTSGILHLSYDNTQPNKISVKAR